MGYFSYYLISALFLVLWTIISWVVTDLLHLKGTTEMLVRVLLMSLGGCVFGLVFWFKQRRERRKAAQAGAALAGVTAQQEIDFLLRTAEGKLVSSRLGRESRLGTLPVVFLFGETGAAKTSIFVQSGTEPELLTGQVYQDQAVVQTRLVNIWLAQKTVFIEAGGRLLADPAAWMHLVRRLRPARLRSLFSKRQEAARAAMVCVDGETFLKPGAEEALSATASNLHARLGEMARTLGVSFPFYVLFAKLDRMGYFTEFVGNLTDEEVRHVLGATLPIRAESRQGVYAEEESQLLAQAFGDISLCLCDKRLPFLARENDPAIKPGVYEFPREFRKLRRLLVQFLVDLGRPSQLQANPFLRGFYFTGVRPVVVKEAAPVARASEGARRAKGATGLFGDEAEETPVTPASGGVRTRRVPQWLFLSRLFSEVVLRDRLARGAAGLSSSTQLGRRILLTAVTVLALIGSVGFTVSYFGNRALESGVLDAARGIGPSESGGAAQELPSRSALERLETLRHSVEVLSLYQREGPPLRLRWGLYAGDRMYPQARRIYFSRFHQLLFGATQNALLEHLRKLPRKPGPSDEYRPTYDTLKAYLITTSHPDKSTRLFLSPFLLAAWVGSRPVDPERRALASKQFDFYSEELKLGNPFSKENDGEAVERSRYYLSHFNAVERIYQFMIAEASRQNPAVNFNRQFPGSAAYVFNNQDVAGAFSVKGWEFMQAAFKKIPQFFGGERWVLGDRTYESIDPAKIEPELQARYRNDFIGQWRKFLAQSEVAPYRGVADAAQKLQQLSSNQSFLLALFCVATVNTNVPSEEAKLPYQPVHFVEPPGCPDRYVQGSNSGYVSALVNLQTAMDRVAKAGADLKDDLVSQTLNEATSAYRVTRQIAQNFRIDREGNVHGMVQKLMEDPIKHAEGILGRLGPAQLNSEGKRFCTAFLDLTRKYPFNTASKVDAAMEEIASIFRPGDGKLYTFYETNLKNHLERQGPQFIRKADSRVHITDGFLRFYNRAMAFSEALYKGGAREPHLAYTMRALSAEGLQGIHLTLDGQVLKGSGRGGESKDFTWPGSGAQGARLAGNLGGGDFSFITYEGLWAAFRFFGDADRFDASGANYVLQWVPRQGQSAQPMRLESGKPLAIPFSLDLRGAPPIFQKGYLSGFDCVSEVAR